MDPLLTLGIVVSLGWILGFWLLNKLVNWMEIRMTWWLHTLNEQSWLQMNETAEQRLNREYWELLEQERRDNDGLD